MQLVGPHGNPREGRLVGSRAPSGSPFLPSSNPRCTGRESVASTWPPGVRRPSTAGGQRVEGLGGSGSDSCKGRPLGALLPFPSSGL